MERNTKKGWSLAEQDPSQPKEEYPPGHFPLDVFPYCIIKNIEDKKLFKHIDKNYQASAWLSAIASYLNKDVNVLGNFGEYRNRPILFFALLGTQSGGKSPALDDAFRYLKEIHDKNKKEAEINQEPFVPYYATDFTTEGLMKHSKNNERGIWCEIDEVSGWIKSFSNQNNGGSKEVFIKLFSGNPISKVLAGDSYSTPSSCINVFGGIQPVKLKYLFNPESLEDGFVIRFLMCRKLDNSIKKLPKSDSIHRQSQALNRLPTDKEMQNLMNYTKSNSDSKLTKPADYTKLIKQIFALEPKDYHLTPEADDRFIDWKFENEKKYQSDSFMFEYQGKLGYYFFRIALVLFVAKKMKPDGTLPALIDIDTIEDTIRVIEFYRNEMEAIREDEIGRAKLRGYSTLFQEVYREDIIRHKEYSATQLVKIFESNNVCKKTRIYEIIHPSNRLFIKKNGKYLKRY